MPAGVKNRFFDVLFSPVLLGIKPDEAKRYTRDELLAGTGVTARQLSYYIKLGAVDPPIGRTRSAKYSLVHAHQLKRVVDVLSRGQITVAEIGEAFAAYRTGHTARNTSGAPRPTTSIRETVYWLTKGIRVVTSESLLPSEQVILGRVLKAGEATRRERFRLADEAVRGLAGDLNRRGRSSHRYPA